MLKFLIAATVALSLAACSFDKNDNNNANKAQEDNQKALAEFKVVKGQYAGTMVMGGINYKVTLNLDARLQKSDRKDNNGQPVMDVVRLGNLKRINPAGPEYTFDVSLSKELRTISLVNVDGGNNNPQKPALSKDDIHTIDATYGDQKIVGRLLNNAAVEIGTLNVTLTSTESESQNEKQDQEYYDNLRKEYEPLIGTYIGDSVKDGKALQFKMTIQLRPQPVGDVSAPQLYGTFIRTDDKTGNSALSLTFNYQNLSNPKRLYIVGKPSEINRLDYVANFDGVMQNNAYIGTWSTQRGFEGSFELIKQEPPKPTPTPTPDPNATCSLRGTFPCLPETVPTPIPRPKK